ncbi:MAG: 1-acyl-sn-glycerol-3-phosphate acyltransferase [Alphaproteobacteria bacterium]
MTMTRRYWLRSSLFNLAFYGVTAIACIACLPTLAFPRQALLKIVRIWVGTVFVLEKYILGLRFEIRGLEHLPKDGKSYIIAAKHQSAYETMKLHTLFGDPAIILKQELLKIPLWGAYLKKSDVIAIDRSTPDAAIASIQDGAKRMMSQNRPIVIFPQGTRVRTDQTAQDKPYKIGVMRIQEATGLPIIPLALNSGYFWPRKGWFKRPGTVAFEFLPPIIAASDKAERGAALKALEAATEEKSEALLKEAEFIEQQKLDDKGGFLAKTALLGLALAAILYAGLWYVVSEQVKMEAAIFMSQPPTAEDGEPLWNAITRQSSGVALSGFPGRIHLTMDQESFRFPRGRLDISAVTLKGWPIPALPVEIETGAVTFQSILYEMPFVFDQFTALITPLQNRLNVHHAALRQGELEIAAEGVIERAANQTAPQIDITVSIKNHEALIRLLTERDVIDSRTALFVSAGLRGLQNEDGIVTLPLSVREGRIFAGPFMIGEWPENMEF